MTIALKTAKFPSLFVENDSLTEDWLTECQPGRQTDRGPHTGRQTEIQTGRETDRQRKGQKSRQVGRQKETIPDSQGY
jgi:hypothetical protein